MVQHTFSWWGIKNNGEDITPEIMRIINSAKQFVIVCGYNFTFRSSVGARPFFDALKTQSLAGVKILLIFPPNLYGPHNPQPAIINHCLTNNLPVILNHHNHSKWLLTDEDLYYGSSNFTNASWKTKVEVLSIHEHTKLGKGWSQDTIKDFKNFIDNEIADLTATSRRMKNYRGLLTSTRNAWKSLKPLVQKFNPSIEKVKRTLGNYDNIISIVNQEVVSWFDYYSKMEFETICNLSSKILKSVDELFEYAYGNIYNETVEEDNIEINSSKIDEYNKLYEQLLFTIDECIENLPKEDERNMNLELRDLNLKKIEALKIIMDERIN